MDRWRGRVAVVTGASSGIGAATAKNLAIAGLTTIGLARRVELMEVLKNSLPCQAASRFHPFRCDVTKEDDILRAFAFVRERFGGVDILINNAGVFRGSPIFQPGNGQDVRDVYNTNVVGLLHCSREALQSMKSRCVEGHIINVNSVLGQKVIDEYGISLYTGSKFAVTALTESMRYELRNLGSNVRVTSISPGMTNTAMIWHLPNLDQYLLLEPEDIADAIQYVLSAPQNVMISELTIRPTGGFL